MTAADQGATFAFMPITQTTTFPVTPAMPGGNQITVSGNNGSELKSALLAVLAQRQANQQAGSQVLADAVAAINA